MQIENSTSLFNFGDLIVSIFAMEQFDLFVLRVKHTLLVSCCFGWMHPLHSVQTFSQFWKYHGLFKKSLVLIYASLKRFQSIK